MTKIERVRAALRGTEVDRVPASFWFHFPPEQAHGLAAVRAHLDYYRASGVDFLKVMNEYPYRADVEIRSPSDWRRVRPAPLSSPFFQQQLDDLKRIADGVAGECLVITTVFGPFAAAGHTSREMVTEHLRADPEAVGQGMAAIAESLTEFCLACVGAGAAGIYYSAQGGERTRLTQGQFLEYVKPQDLAVLQAISGAGEFHLLHICGEGIRLEAYADYPSHAVNWAVGKGNPGLSEGKRLFRRTVVGGMDSRGILVSGSRQEIQTAVREVIAGFGTRGLMLGADCTLPTDTPIENIRAAVEATAL